MYLIITKLHNCYISKSFLGLVFCLTLIKYDTLAQFNSSNLKIDTLSIQNCKVVTTKKYLLPSSIKVYSASKIFAPNQFQLFQNTIIFNDSLCQELGQEKIWVEYRYIDLIFDKVFTTFDTNQIKKSGIAMHISQQELQKNKSILDFNSKNINYNGSFSRGFSVGNAQSLVINSKFDMQLEGDIGDGIKIKGAITDDNIPIQAEGNTQSLQEFDRVYLELNKSSSSLRAGDYPIQNSNAHFLIYTKKIKGLGATNIYETKKGIITSSANIAASRGKFFRTTVATKEGNQGPYKLSGINGERYIIILSGSERIYHNGILLKRGFDADYIIDYNLAELTFMPNVFIARESRIIIEYEYTDQNYFRTLYTAATSWVHNNSLLAFNFYSEQDSKKTTGQIELDSTARLLLQNGGDHLQDLKVLSLRKAEKDEQVIKYIILKNPEFPIDINEYYLKYANESNQQLYAAAFSEVGSGNGSYIIDPTIAVNGRVYKFVGHNKGNYDPITKLIPPESKQMMNLKYESVIAKNFHLSSDISLSNFDKNKFSTLNDNDNIGLAGQIGLNGKSKFKLHTNDSTTQLIYGVSLEKLNSQFNILNQYRRAEFNRDWNYSGNNNNQELLFNTQLGIQKRNGNRFMLSYDKFDATTLLGNRWLAEITIKTSTFEFIALPSLVTTKKENNARNFLRPNFLVTQIIPQLDHIKLGVTLEAESNISSQTGSDADSSSYRFYYTKYFIETNHSRNVKLKLSYNLRNDDFSNKIVLKHTYDIKEYEASTSWLLPDISDLNVSLKLRNFKVLHEETANNQKSKLTLLSNINHTLTLFKSAIVSNSTYQINSGQEPKIEYVYQKIENIRGDYVYIGPDTIVNKNINDFRYDPSNPLASYVRFVVPNNEFVTTNNLLFNQSIKLEPSLLIKKDTTTLKPFANFINKLTALGSIRLTNKLMSNDSYLSLWNFNDLDTTVISYNKLLNASIFFNRGNPSYDISIIHIDNAVKTNQINGFDIRNNRDDEAKLRINTFTNTDLFLYFNMGSKYFQNKLYTERNFDIIYKKYNAEISFRPNTKMRFNIKYSNSHSQQLINAKESSNKNEVQFSINRRAANTANIDLTFSYIDVKYKGASNSFVAYDILESLKPGNNYLWGINLTKRISKMVDLIVSYEGRKTGLNKVINVMRMEAKATF